jgi:hypothetical protein
MRSKTQERIEELARERTVACRAEAIGEGGAAIDLTLVEEGIEIGKTMMAEMIATCSGPPSAGASSAMAEAPGAARDPQKVGAPSNERGYLNEVSPLTAQSANRGQTLFLARLTARVDTMCWRSQSSSEDNRARNKI